MKITDLALLSILVFLPISLVIDISQHRQIEAQNWKQVYNEVMYTASEDATLALLERSGQQSQEDFFEGVYKSSKNVSLNLDKSLSRFLETVYLNLNIENDRIAQNAIKAYLPIQMVVGYDGLYVHTWQNVFNSSAGKYETRELWAPKIPYSYYDDVNNLVVNFTLDDYTYVYNNTTAEKNEGRRSDLVIKYPVNIFVSEETFENVRRQTIIELIQRQLEYYTNRNNYLAMTTGQSYIFNIPIINGESWNNTINDICFISFLQGLVLPGTNENYSTFGFGGTKLKLTNKYYGNTISDVKFYHRLGCSQLTGTYSTFNSKKDAAEEGYRYCPTCKP